MIYVKIADLFSDKILSGEFQAKSRVPSIRFTNDLYIKNEVKAISWLMMHVIDLFASIEKCSEQNYFQK